MKERGKQRYFWRAGVMSRNERMEEKQLSVMTAFFIEKTCLLLRVTVVREGMSACEEREIEVLSRLMERGKRNVQLLIPSVVSVVSLGKSIHQFISSYPLRIINSLESSFLKQNTSSPSRMEVNSGKSAHHSHFNPFTLKHCTRTITECTITKQK